MKTIVLRTLCLRNFKGIELLEIAFSGTGKDIYGANETGKSSLVTAFNWLLTGKDEFDRKDYLLKNTVKRELNHQGHEVEAVFDITENGAQVEVKLRRLYSEVWTKPKGQPTKVFAGHTTAYFYNDVPCNEREYNSRVNGVIPADLIKLLTNPTHFNNLPWQEQRVALLKISGNITNQQVFDIIATPENDFMTLIMVLNSGKTIDDYKKELAAKKLLLKKTATEFAPRIDEARRNMPQAADWANVEAELNVFSMQVIDIDEQLQDAAKAANAANKAMVEKQGFLYKRQAVLRELKHKTKEDFENKQFSKSKDLSALQHQMNVTSLELQQFKQQYQAQRQSIENYTNNIQQLNTRVDKYRAEWRAINAEQFTFDAALCNCPTCGQALQPDVIENKQETLKTNFLKHQTERKNDLVAKSNQVKTEILQYEQMIAKMREADYEEKITAENNKIEALQHKLTEMQLATVMRPVVDVDAAVDALLKLNEDALYLEEEIAGLQAEIQQEQGQPQEQPTDDLRARKQALLAQMKPLEQQLAQKENMEKTKKRIKQLQDDEQLNAQAIADVERQEFDIEKFTRAKMDILEQRVNELFEFVAFRLFEVQVNGGIAENCICEYKGVAFPTLNTAAKMLAGIDIIHTLTKFYGICAPVFVDNRESVTYLPTGPNQLISLYVSDADKILRIQEAGTAAENNGQEKQNEFYRQQTEM